MEDMENTPAPLEANWKPNKWVAAILGILMAPFAMLYLGRPRLALVYFLTIVLIVYAQYWLAKSGNAPWAADVPVIWVLAILCAMHAYRLAKSGSFPLPRVWYSRWYGMVAIVASYFILAFVGRSFFYESFRTPSDGMRPTFQAGARIIVKKLGYGNYGTYGVNIVKMALSEKIERGDVMVFQYPLDPTVTYAKRIIGLPGDVVSYQSKALTINGLKVQSALLQDYGSEQLVEERYDGKTWQTIIKPDRESRDFSGTVPEHQYFVLGDNRDNSADSRYWGFVPEENLVGKMVYVFK